MTMTVERPDVYSLTLRDARTVAVLGGVGYAVAVLSWLFSEGVHFASQEPGALVFGYGYALVGMFLTAAVPLYLFGRFSLVSPPLATLSLLGETAYQWAYGTHLHPLPSYLTVWPILLGFTLAVTAGEATLRVVLDRAVGRFGLRPLL
ncbi:hypothetical protein [Halorussus halobius]|uniref:hypothetical protein n=1 Tax=Halorussus halobius TaxID=1710537 RepID=UPI001FCE5E26|nr:hypothetical protein [Halorussus halobius]